jgi:hypothetical protein
VYATQLLAFGALMVVALK